MKTMLGMFARQFLVDGSWCILWPFMTLCTAFSSACHSACCIVCENIVIQLHFSLVSAMKNMPNLLPCNIADPGSGQPSAVQERRR
jgi:hypothetical protein